MVGLLINLIISCLTGIVNLSSKKEHRDVGNSMKPIPLNIKKVSHFDDYCFKFNYVNNELQRLNLKILQLRQHILTLKTQLASLKKEDSLIVSLSEYKNIAREIVNSEMLLSINIVDKNNRESEHEKIKQIIDRKSCAILKFKQKNSITKRKTHRKDK